MRISDWSSDVCSSDLYPKKSSLLLIGSPRADSIRSRRSANDLHLGEEEADFGGRRLRRIRSVHRIRLDRLAEFLADRAALGIRRVRRAHDLAATGHRALAYQPLGAGGAGRYASGTKP